MLIEEFLVIFCHVQELALRDIQVAELPQIARVGIADLLQQVTTVSQEPSDFVANAGQFRFVSNVIGNIRHSLVDGSVHPCQVALLFFDAYLGETDFGQRRLPVPDLTPKLRELGEILAFFDEQAADDLADAADLEALT